MVVLVEDSATDFAAAALEASAVGADRAARDSVSTIQVSRCCEFG